MEPAAKPPRWHRDSTPGRGRVEGSRARGSLPRLRSCRGAWGAGRGRKSSGRNQTAAYRDAPANSLAVPMLREPLGMVTHSWPLTPLQMGTPVQGGDGAVGRG